jgi:uncharacterized RDD family membrane protein YckC
MGMDSQFDKLRTHFDGLNTAEKKDFIAKLKAMGNKGAEHGEFVNECVQKYNREMEGGSQSRNDYDDLLDNSESRCAGIKAAEPAKRLGAYFIDLLLFLPGYILIGIQLYFSSELSWVSEMYNRGGVYDPVLRMRIPIPPEVMARYLSDIQRYSMLVIVFGLLGLACLIFAIVVSIKCWKKGTSFGKRRLGLVAVNKETGVPLTGGYMFLRETIGKAISGLILSLGYIWILIDKDKQGWHDKLCSSVVVVNDKSR